MRKGKICDDAKENMMIIWLRKDEKGENRSEKSAKKTGKKME